MSKKEKAFKYFNMGYNCSQSVLAAFSDELGVNEKDALKIASSFGGGMNSGNVCGAVTGALMVLGLKYGDISSEVPIDSITKEFQGKFKEKNKSLDCRDLLGYDISKESEFKDIMDKNLFEKVCPKLINSAVDILEDLKIK